MVHVPRVLETGSSRHLVVAETVVVIPAYQAARSIHSVVEELRKDGLSVIVVDDASLDATAQEARRAGAQVLVRKTNGGKGTALREGFAEVLAGRTRWVLTLDADGQHLPSDIPRFLDAASDGKVDLLLGNRMENPTGMPLERKWTNRFMSWILSHLIGQNIPDTQCGFRMISREVLEKVTLTSDRFEIDSELVVKAAWAGFRIASIPVGCVYRRQFSFIRPLRDTVRFLRFLRAMQSQRPR